MVLWLRSLIKSLKIGDFWGGLAASAVVLPQAMAFGVALMVPAGIEAARGALAGLIGAGILCAVAGAAGGTRGMISAPTGPGLVLLGGAFASLTAAGVHGQDLLTAMMLIMIMTGIFQILIGLSGGGQLIKYIPYAVISGFMTGSAILMIRSQLNPLTGSGFTDDWQALRWIPAVAAVTTYLAMTFGPKLLPKIPGTISGLICGTVIFHLLSLLGSGGVPEPWLIGALPGFDSISFDYDMDMIRQFPFKVLITASLALSILASLDTLLTSLVADVETGERHNARIEMCGQGAGQIMAAFAGGMAGAGTTGSTVVAVKSGGRRWVGLFAGIIFLLLLAVGRGVGQILPIGVLAGVIIHVAIHMVDLDIVRWLQYKRSRMDAMIAILVTVITVVYDLMIAVGVGVAIAIILFIRSQIKATVVHRRSTAVQMRSNKRRPSMERELLDQHGDRIVLYELRGNLFFATADRLLSELGDDLNRDIWMILHMRRVQQIDLTATKILQQIADRIQDNGGQLIFCNVHKGMGLGKKVQKTMKKVSKIGKKLQVLTFNGKEEALEYAEDALLEELGVTSTTTITTVDLKDMDLCQNMTGEQVSMLESIMKNKFLPADRKLFSIGDEGKELYIVKSGEIDIRLPTTKHHYKRLANYGPGTLFGELAFLYPGPRTANAVAIQDSDLLILDRDSFETLKKDSPPTAIELLHTLSRIQVNQARWSTQEIQRLSEW